MRDLEQEFRYCASASGSLPVAAKSFEDEFEDARDVASRGMTITGQDAA